MEIMDNCKKREKSRIIFSSCPKHKREYCLYCKDCLKALCDKCVLDDNLCKNHTTITLVEMDSDITKGFQGLLPTLERILRRVSSTTVVNNDKPKQNINRNFNDNLAKNATAQNVVKEDLSYVKTTTTVKMRFEFVGVKEADSEIQIYMKKIIDMMNNDCNTVTPSGSRHVVKLTYNYDTKSIPWYEDHPGFKKFFKKIDANPRNAAWKNHDYFCDFVYRTISHIGRIKKIKQKGVLKVHSKAARFRLQNLAKKKVKPPKKVARKKVKAAKYVAKKNILVATKIILVAKKYVKTANRVAKKKYLVAKKDVKTAINKIAKKKVPVAKKKVLVAKKKVLVAKKKVLVAKKNVKTANEVPKKNMKTATNGANKDVRHKNIAFPNAIVTHIVNPHYFYVQTEEQQTIIKKMNREINNDPNLIMPEFVTLEAIYIGRSDFNPEWRRCRVTRRICGENFDLELLEIYFIDYGDTASITIDSLREIPYNSVSQPPLVILCKLANCTPYEDTWTKDDTSLMMDIVQNQRVQIAVRTLISQPDIIYECDLIIVKDNISVAHCLAFYDRARLIDPTEQMPCITKFNGKLKGLYCKKQSKLVEDTEYRGVITHVVSPDKFFVRKVFYQDKYHKLCVNMDRFYKKTSYELYYPIPGMASAVHVSKCDAKDNHEWQRAAVVYHLGNQYVRVYLIDTGEYMDSHYTELRRLHDKFAVETPLAYECHLDGLGTEPRVWTEMARQVIVDCMGKFEIIFKAHNYYFGQKSLSVSLIRNKNNITFDVNREIITKHLDESIRRAFSSRYECCSLVWSRAETTARVMNSLKQVKVLSCTSPSTIYVALIEQLSQIRQLYIRLNKYFIKNYNNTNSRRNWRVGDKCCVLSDKFNYWCRAIITEIHEKEVTVFFVDFAHETKVNKFSIMELPRKFSEIPNGAILCHLSDIAPHPGPEWSTKANMFVNRVSQIFLKNYVYFKEYNEYSENFPVHICGIWINKSGELSHHCYNKILVSRKTAIWSQTNEEHFE